MSDRSDYIARLIYLDGLSYREAGSELGIGIESVKTHLKRWKSAHDLSDRGEIVAYFREGVVTR